jgi:N-acetylneuraminic acid mutarotase
MVAGGFTVDAQGEPVDLLTVEVFDPVAGTWSEAGTIPESAYLPGLTSLQDGRLLLTGGRSAAFFDPSTDTWTETTDLIARRTYHAAVELDDGRVLVIGGIEERAAEAFDPISETWTIRRHMSTFRVAPTVTSLDSGHILVTGGSDIDYRMTIHSDGEVYDPDANTWTVISPMSVPRVVHSSTLLRDGSVLIAGGTDQAEGGEPYASAERLTIPTLAGTAPRRSGGRTRP